MNAVGIDGKGENVWMAHFLYYLLCAWAELPLGDTVTAKRFRREADSLRDEVACRRVNDADWQSEHFPIAEENSVQRIEIIV